MRTDFLESEVLEAVVVSSEVDTAVAKQPETFKAIVVIPSDELEKINATEANLLQLAAKAQELVAAGISNKAERKVVHDLAMAAVYVRTDAEKVAARLAAPYKKEAEKYIKAGKFIGEMAKQSEEVLKKIRNDWDDEQERIAEVKALAARIRYAKRTQQLQAWGYQYDPETDSFSALGDIINVDDIRNLPDEEYEIVEYGAGMAYRIEQDRLAEIKRVADEEAQRIEQERQTEAVRIEQERQAERDRLIKIANEQEATRKQQEARDAELRRKELELKIAQDTAVLATRRPALVAIGFVEKGSEFQYGHTHISHIELIDMSQSQVDNLLLEIEDEKRLREQHRLDDEAKEAQRIKDAAQAEKDRKKADKERQARLKPDKKDIGRFMTGILNAKPWPVLTDPETTTFANEFYTRLTAFVEKERADLDAL